MKKKTKSLYFTVLSCCLCLCFLIFFVSCSNTEKGTLSVNSFPSEGLVFELGNDEKIPVGTIKSSSGEILNQKIEYNFTSPSGKSITGYYPAVYCNEVGKWEVEYKYFDQSIKKEFEVKDTTPPQLTLTNRPADVFADGTTLYTLPQDTVTDISELDYENAVMELTLNGKEVEFNKLTRKFTADEPGVFNYKVTIKDIYGNTSTASETWNSKKVGWVDTDLPENYLATYDCYDYISTVEGGDISAYWVGKPYEEYLEEFEGAKGVLKVTTPPIDPYDCAAIKFRLSRTLSAEEMKNKYVIIKLMTTTNVDSLIFGSIKYIPEMECSQEFSFPVTPNEWTYLQLSYDNLMTCHYFDPGEEGFNAFQIGFGQAFVEIMNEDCVVYIDSVTIADKLSDVKNITLNNEVLSWDAVDGAKGYEVDENGKKTVVETNSYKVTDPDAVLKVKALAEQNSVFYIDSEQSVYIDTTGYAEENDLARFDNKAYEEMVYKSTYLNRDAYSIKGEYLEEYKGEKGVLKVTTVTNGVFGNGIGIGDLCFKLPLPCTDGLTIKYMVGSTDATFRTFLIPGTEYGIENQGEMSTADENWKTVYLDYRGVENKDKIEIMLQGGTENSENVFYFALVKDGDRVNEMYFEQMAEALEQERATLEEGYLADFDNESYEKFICDSTIAAGTHTAEYVEEVGGEKGVVKITLTADSGKNGYFTIKLPKAMTSGENGFTIRYMVESSDAAAARFFDPVTGEEVKTGKTISVAAADLGVWKTVHVAGQTGKLDEILVYFWDNTVETPNVIYISYVKDGNI